ncbi:hypothetical protein, partial [Candidatus Merdisoma sp. JLR.KK006]|uniref:hypothetical protein n=1 Tax=Candidatus Merdisoma sp. JLR.KK006 TaxID=3112626 RepID=UPI002FF18A29
MANRYSDYFNVDEEYFPCFDESAIHRGATWNDTYPHKTFIELLNAAEKMLGGTTNRSLWIHGAYGTGKSKCAYALKKILEVSEDELRTYWNKYDQLKNNQPLLGKILGHKEQGIVCAYRYASGSITTPQQLFTAVQETIKTALDDQNVAYKGENTLKESVIAWLEDTTHNTFMNDLLKKPEWISTFSQSTADEIINALRKSDDVSKLMEHIFKLAAKEGITALSLDADSIRKWILDIIKQNNGIKIVFVWDEFSDFFRQNKNSFSEFQKLVSICQEAPFYFVVVTHPISSISINDDSWKIVQQRFDKIEIAMPSNIAFDLIADAFKPKPEAVENWNQLMDDLNARVSSSRQAVMKSSDVTNEIVMKNMLPIHPMTAITLKNIAVAYQANQRSMFDFIKTPKELDTQAFQWFIQEFGPEDDRPFITIDRLWDFFYVKGSEYLTSDIKLILGTFPQQTMLTEKEKVVLKTVLIMQAIDQSLGGEVEVLKPTDQNLSYAFEGDFDQYENECRGIAKGLVNKGILILTPIGDNKKVYNVAVLAGDGAKIEQHKKEIRDKSTIVKLTADAAQLPTALNLPPALKLRYGISPDNGDLPIVTVSNFIKIMDDLKHKETSWHFKAVLALAKTEDEAQYFRNIIKETISKEEYKDIVVVDALSIPLGVEAFEQYVDYSAMTMYYTGNSNQQAKDNARKASDVLNREWKERIYKGQFIVYTYANQNGEKANNTNELYAILQTIVLIRFNHVMDFTKNLIESQFKLTQTKQIARYGIGGIEIKGLIAGCEKSVLGKVWDKPEYWNDPGLEREHIVIIKKAVDKIISEAFQDSGKISIGEIYDYLERTFGFSQCNLSAFITGFLLKEYSGNPYRSMNGEGHREEMTPEKLAEMIGNYIGKMPKPTYIVNLTEEEKAFYELTETAWSIEPDTCNSPSHAGSLIKNKMKALIYPVWCLEDIDSYGVYDIVKEYIVLVQEDGERAHDIANVIGKMAMQRPSSGDNLKMLLTAENCKKGMKQYLLRFEGGRLLNLAKDIGAEDLVLSDIKNVFSVEYSAYWNNSTGEDELYKLMVEYEVVKQTNYFLNVMNKSKDDAFESWRETLKFIGFSGEAAQNKYPALQKVLMYLLNIAKKDDMLPDAMQQFSKEMHEHSTELNSILKERNVAFMEIYAPYLEGFNEIECDEIRKSIKTNMFVEGITQGNGNVKRAADEYRKNQIKTQMYNLWKSKAEGTKNPREWSNRFRVPILCCIDNSIYNEAKRAFAVLNSSIQSDAEIKSTIEFLENAVFFTDISYAEFREECFCKVVVGEYANMLPNIDDVKDAIETLGYEIYEWVDNPVVKNKIKELAIVEYNAGGSERAISTIDKMSDSELKGWLKELVKKDLELGIKIIKN